MGTLMLHPRSAYLCIPVCFDLKVNEVCACSCTFELSACRAAGEGRVWQVICSPLIHKRVSILDINVFKLISDCRIRYVLIHVDCPNLVIVSRNSNVKQGNAHIEYQN